MTLPGISSISHFLLPGTLIQSHLISISLRAFGRPNFPTLGTWRVQDEISSPQLATFYRKLPFSTEVYSTSQRTTVILKSDLQRHSQASEFRRPQMPQEICLSNARRHLARVN